MYIVKTEYGNFCDVAGTAIEAFDHALSSRTTLRSKTALDIDLLTQPIERIRAASLFFLAFGDKMGR